MHLHDIDKVEPNELYMRIGRPDAKMAKNLPKIAFTNIASIYSIAKFWLMLEKILKVENKKEMAYSRNDICNVLYCEEFSSFLLSANANSLARFFTGTEQRITNECGNKLFQILEKTKNIEIERYRKIFCQKNELFEEKDIQIIKDKVLKQFFTGRQFFIKDSNTSYPCYVTPNGYLEILSDLKQGKEVLAKLVEKICIYKINEKKPIDIFEKNQVTIDMLYKMQTKAMEYELVYMIEEGKKTCTIHIVEKGMNETIEEAREFLNSIVMRGYSVKGSEYNLMESSSFYNEQYKKIEEENAENAIISLIMSICSQQLVGHYIDEFFSWNEKIENDMLSDKIKKQFYLNHSKEVINLLKENKEEILENLKNKTLFEDYEYKFIYYILGKYIDDKLIDEGFFELGSSKQCYEIYLYNVKSVSSHDDCDMIGAASYEMALKSKSSYEIKALKKYIKMAEEAEYLEIYELKGDCYISGLLDGTSEAYDKAIECYKKASTGSSKRKMFRCAKKYVSDLEKIGKHDEAKKICEEIRELAIAEGVEEAQIEYYVERESTKLKENTEQKINYLSEQTTFVILGYSDATKAFLDSISCYENKKVYLIVGECSEYEKKTLSKKYPFIHIEFEYVEEILEQINMFHIDYISDNILPHETIHEKLVFVGLANKIEDNIQFAIQTMQIVWKTKLQYEQQGNIWNSLEENIEIMIEGKDKDTSLYLDAVQKTFGDFYVPVHVIDYSSEVANELLLEYPLFLPLLKNSNMEYETCNIVILGNDNSIIQLVKNILAVGWFHRGTYDFENKDMEYDIKKSLSITLVDKNANKLLDKIKYDCPAYGNTTMIQTVLIDVTSYDFICTVLGNGHEDSLKLGKGNYFICATERDDENISLGIKLRQLLCGNGKMDVEIAVLCRNSFYANNVKDFTIEDKLVKKKNMMSNYNLCVYGEYSKSFSYENLCNNLIRKLALAIHQSYYNNNYFGQFEALNAYYSKQYNRDSSEMEALSFIYKLFSAGIFEEKAMEWFPKVRFTERSQEIEVWLKQYEQYLLVPEHIEKMAILEHYRWCHFMMSRGWRTATKAQVRDYLSMGNTSHQFHIAKLHPYLVPWSELGERVTNFTITDYLASIGSKLKLYFDTYMKRYMQYADNRDESFMIRRNSSYRKLHRIGKNYEERCNLFKDSNLKEKQIEQEYIENLVNIEKIFHLFVELDKEVYHFGINVLEYIEGTGEAIDFIKGKLESFESSYKEKKVILENHLQKLNEEQKELVEDYCYVFIQYFCDTERTAEFKKPIEDLLKELKKCVNTDLHYGSTGVQAWIDQYMAYFQLKISNSSIRENNKKTVKGELEIMKAYCEKIRYGKEKFLE